MISFRMKFVWLMLLVINGAAKRVDGGQRALTEWDPLPDTTMTCKPFGSSYCKGDWKFFGNGQCCTYKWATCTQASYSYCKTPWTFMGNDQCCLTTDHQVWLTELKASYSYCNGKSDLTFMGNDNCVTTKWAKCTKASYTYCKTPWTFLGNDQCCLISDHQVWLTELKASYTYCNGKSGFTYMGNDNCVTTKWAKCTKASYSYCKTPWTYLGNDQCCLTSDHQVWLTELKASYASCQRHSDFIFMGNDKCVTTKNVHCTGATYGSCPSTQILLGTDHCCFPPNSY